MKRALASLVLLGLVVSLAFVHVTPVSGATGEVLKTLDVCSLQHDGSTGDMSTIAAPFFEVFTLQAEAPFVKEPLINVLNPFSSRIEKPPRV
jgi:hypothetical protein